MKRKLAFIVSAVLLLTCLVSCWEAPEPEPTRACVFIVGNHANANYIGDMPGSSAYKKAAAMLKSCFRVSTDSPVGSDDTRYDIEVDIGIIVCDGNPEVVDPREYQFDLYLADIENSKNSSYKKKVQKFTDSVISFMFSEELRADDMEVDLLAALTEAQKVLARFDAEEKHIFIIDTGITTTGYLNMRIPEYNITVTDFRTIYHDNMPESAFPDLEGIKVTFEGLGNVAGMQTDMRSNNAFANNLVGLWTMMLTERMHATLADGEILYAYREGTPMMYTEEDTSYPFVSKVYFRGDQPIIEPSDWGVNPAETEPPETEPPETEPEETEPAETEPPAPDDTIVIPLPHQELGFKADSADFIDKMQAIYVIEEFKDDIVEFLNADSTNKLYIVGSIANTSDNLQTRTAKYAGDRAEAVAKLLYERGVPEERIVVINAGTTKFTWRNTDEFKNGAWDNKLAEFNRVVAIIGSTSEAEVAELRDNHYID